MSALPQQLERVVLTLCEDVGSPVSRKVADLVTKRDYRQLVSLTIDPSTYSSADDLLKDRACVEFLRKYTGFEIDGVDKADRALENFWSSEQSCYAANKRLHRFLNHQGPFEGPDDLRLLECLEWMRNWIGETLGRLPRELSPRFGPGATYYDVGKYITVPDKMTSRPSSTLEARSILPLWSKTAWARALLKSNQNQSDPEIVRGNRFTTVPKDAMKDRGIAIEPSINVGYQLAIGRYLRRRLYVRRGIDLLTAQPKHRRMAMSASRDRSLATIDLSNASDTVSKTLVQILLPAGWFELLNTFRSPFTLVKGNWVRLEKFSSMGNGYTFELETLIYSAICAWTLHHSEDTPKGASFWVYGDDIILPTEVSGTALGLLRWLGFSPNQRKTFITGPFRESCGGDYFDGLAVRPYHQKDVPDEPAKWIAMANGIRRMGCQDPDTDFRDSIFQRAWLRTLDAIPSDIRRLRGPEDLGDLVIHDYPESWRVRRTPDFRSYIQTWNPIAPKLPLHHWKPEVVLASALYGVPSDGVALRDYVTGYRSRWTALPR